MALVAISASSLIGVAVNLQAFVSLLGLEGALSLGVFLALGVAAISARRLIRGDRLLLTACVVTMSVALLCATLSVAAVRKSAVAEANAAPVSGVENVDFSNSSVTARSFVGSNLRNADLHGATVTDVNLDGADLSESDLRGAIFISVNFAKANLCAADLRGADLSRSDVDGVSDWRFAVYDEDTKWPADFDIEFQAGPVDASQDSLLYSCEPGTARYLDVATGGRQ